MREMHKLAESGVNLKTTLEEDLVWWSAINLWAWVSKNVTYFDHNSLLFEYSETKFRTRLPAWIVDSCSGAVTMPMLRTNTGKAVEELAIQFVSKK